SDGGCSLRDAARGRADLGGRAGAVPDAQLVDATDERIAARAVASDAGPGVVAGLERSARGRDPALAVDVQAEGLAVVGVGYVGPRTHGQGAALGNGRAEVQAPQGAAWLHEHAVLTVIVDEPGAAARGKLVGARASPPAPRTLVT